MELVKKEGWEGCVNWDNMEIEYAFGFLNIALVGAVGGEGPTPIIIETKYIMLVWQY